MKTSGVLLAFSLSFVINYGDPIKDVIVKGFVAALLYLFVTFLIDRK